jgi:Tfp pilus assembly protein PilF
MECGSLWLRRFALTACGAVLIAPGCARNRQSVAKPNGEIVDGKVVENEVKFTKGPKPKPTPSMMSDFGHVFTEVKDWEKATSHFNESLEMDDEHEPGYVGLAQVHSGQQQYDKALAVLADGLKQVPKSAAIYNEMGVTYSKMERYDKAAESFQTAISLAPDVTMYKINLASMYAIKGDYGKSLELYSASLPPAEARYRLAGVLYSRGQEQEALELLTAAQQMDPSHVGVVEAMVKIKYPNVMQAGHNTQGIGGNPNAVSQDQSKVLPATFRQ